MTLANCKTRVINLFSDVHNILRVFILNFIARPRTTIVPCYFVNNPCSVGIMEEGKSGEKLAIKFSLYSKLYCKLLS
jgi:hypothetical protein